MGNFAYENDLIAQNNLPSRRWKRRRIRTARDKMLRAKDKEHTRICWQISELGYEELNPPIQRGYMRLFVLTEASRYSNQSGFYQELLNKINTIRYSPDKIFKQKKRKIGKWRYNYLKEQKLQEPEDYSFHTGKKFTEEEKKYFYPVEYYFYPGKMWRTKYIFVEPWRFELRVRPYMITKVQRKDLELEQFRDELYDFIQQKKNYRRLVKMRGGNGYAWKKVINKKNDIQLYQYNSLRNIPFHQIVENYKQELKWEYDLKN